MKSSSLLSKPDFSSRFKIPCLPGYKTSVVQRVREYFCLHWPWASERQKELFLQYDVELWTFFTCPRAPEDRAEVGAKYSLYWTAIDDLFEHLPHDKAVQAAEGMKQVLLGDRPPQNKLENIIHDIRSEMLSLGDARSREIVETTFMDTVKFMEASVNHLDRPKVIAKGLDEYLKFRFVEVGFRFGLGLIAWGQDLSFPPKHILKDPDFNLLLSLSADQVILINDMYSYRREAFSCGQNLDDISEDTALPDGREPYPFNAVYVLLRGAGVDETNVMDVLAAHIRSKEADFVDAAEKLRRKYKDRTDDLGVIENWVVLLMEAMAGNHYWSSICGRYNILDDTLSNTS